MTAATSRTDLFIRMTELFEEWIAAGRAEPTGRDILTEQLHALRQLADSASDTERCDIVGKLQHALDALADEWLIG